MKREEYLTFLGSDSLTLVTCICIVMIALLWLLKKNCTLRMLMERFWSAPKYDDIHLRIVLVGGIITLLCFVLKQAVMQLRDVLPTAPQLASVILTPEVPLMVTITVLLGYALIKNTN